MRLSVSPPVLDCESSFKRRTNPVLASYSSKHFFSFPRSLQPHAASTHKVWPTSYVIRLSSPSSLRVRGQLTLQESTSVIEEVDSSATRRSDTAFSTKLHISSPKARPEQSSAQVSSSGNAHGPDPFKELHSFVEKEGELYGLLNGPNFTREEISLLVGKLRETRRKGMEMISASKKAKRQLTDNPSHEHSGVLDPDSLVPGEFVVHKAKGIGRFRQLMYDKEKESDYVILEYADGLAKLKSKQASKFLYRYFQPGEKGKAPSLSKLNDSRTWEIRKNKGKLAAQKMVMNMMRLYVSRLKEKRPLYPRHEEAMRHFGAKFPYRPTPDQKQAFLDVERDMVEREAPMDRLICGDVGFGKTEVAMRAIFRAFMSGKQTVVLAPTTVLARQHYEMICERFSGYNAQIGLFSRFQTSAEKREMMMHIKEGRMDIIVGTHALLSNNICYNNLGLLVVDEEQRFGVKQKELIVSFRTSVDVLTLSATPIPRTLALALTGFRDASLMTTPPPERLPIKTHLLEYSGEKIKAAVNFELSREGQVYYVLPRLQGLDLKKQYLQNLFPNAKISVAHGKQSVILLEAAMDSFVRGESEILLCTNIIESGLDVRRVNTIIIEDIQLFGLAQLYQLRGRVGRADKESHAYLFYPKKERLSDEALERLVAIEECCDLGQGFNLAERDLAIRGFGSIFGEKQSGDIAHVGMDFFFDMLFEAFSNAEDHVFFHYDYDQVKLDIQLDHFTTSDYIQDLSTGKAVLYQLENAARNGLQELMQFICGLRSDFGKEPHSFEMLFKRTYIRRMAADLGIHHILSRENVVVMKTEMCRSVFEILKEEMASDKWGSLVTFRNGALELQLLVDLKGEHLINTTFSCLVSLRKALSTLSREDNH